MNNTTTKQLSPAAAKWQQGLQTIRELLTQKMMLSTSADIALDGAHLAQQLWGQLEWKYKIHTHSQSIKSRQEKWEKQEQEVRDALATETVPQSLQDEPVAIPIQEDAGSTSDEDQTGEEATSEEN